MCKFDKVLNRAAQLVNRMVLVAALVIIVQFGAEIDDLDPLWGGIFDFCP
jgi:hypothetical protein